MRVFPVASVEVAVVALGYQALAQVPDAIAAPGEVPMVTIHAVGAQIYKCKVDVGGKLAWQSRQPIAALLIGGKTVGRRYTGPSWELADSNSVTAKIAGRAPGATAKDIPLLKLRLPRNTARVNSLAPQLSENKDQGRRS